MKIKMALFALVALVVSGCGKLEPRLITASLLHIGNPEFSLNVTLATGGSTLSSITFPSTLTGVTLTSLDAGMSPGALTIGLVNLTGLRDGTVSAITFSDPEYTLDPSSTCAVGTVLKSDKAGAADTFCQIVIAFKPTHAGVIPATMNISYTGPSGTFKVDPYTLSGTGTTPTYATWNPSDKGVGVTLSGSDLVASINNASPVSARANMGKSTGKWYWEIKITNIGGNNLVAGIAKSTTSLANYTGSEVDSYGIYSQAGAVGGKYLYAGGFLGTSFLTYTTNDVLGFALDMGAGTLVVYLNGVVMGSTISGLAGTYYPSIGVGGGTGVYTANFGSTAFAYPVPAGYNSGLY